LGLGFMFTNKLIINKNIRRVVICALAVLMLVSAGMSVWWNQQPTETQAEETVYTCQQQAGVDYRVYFKPNRFFPDESAGPGLAYFTPLTDYIQSYFTYQFSGESAAEVDGEYQVLASLTGYIMKDKPDSQSYEKIRVKMWEKTDVLVPPTSFSGNESTLLVEQEVAIDYPAYVDFIDQLKEEYRYTAEVVELSITYPVSIHAVTPGGEIVEELEPKMVIPLDGSAFTIEGQPMVQKDNTLTETNTVPVPGVEKNMKGYAIAAGVFLLLLLLAVFKTTLKIIDPVEQELRRIMKKHGDWIVAGKGRVPAVSAEKMLAMNSFDDLVKVADEMGKPVLYENLADGVHSFYVISDILNYSYILEETVSAEDGIDVAGNQADPDKGIEA